MKIVIMFLSLFLMTSTVLAQLSFPKCNEKSGLQWDLNVEADMKEYHLYIEQEANVADVDTSTVHTVIPQPVGVVSGDNIVWDLDKPLVEGPQYFSLVAVDQVGNKSGLSSEVGCTYDRSPGVPQNVTITLTFK